MGWDDMGAARCVQRGSGAKGCVWFVEPVRPRDFDIENWRFSMSVESFSVVDPNPPELLKSIAIVYKRRSPVTSLSWRLISSFANGKGTDAQAVQIEGKKLQSIVWCLMS
jgi:hypothetical protein